MTRFFSTQAFDMAVVASQIRAWRQGVMEEQARFDLVREPIAPVGHKVTADITVVKSVYSMNYGVYFVTAKTDTKHMVFFSYRDQMATGHRCRIAGTVKAHRDDSTQLNRVKVMK